MEGAPGATSSTTVAADAAHVAWARDWVAGPVRARRHDPRWRRGELTDRNRGVSLVGSALWPADSSLMVATAVLTWQVAIGVIPRRGGTDATGLRPCP